MFSKKFTALTIFLLFLSTNVFAIEYASIPGSPAVIVGTGQNFTAENSFVFENGLFSFNNGDITFSFESEVSDVVSAINPIQISPTIENHANFYKFDASIQIPSEIKNNISQISLNINSKKPIEKFSETAYRIGNYIIDFSDAINAHSEKAPLPQYDENGSSETVKSDENTNKSLSKKNIELLDNGKIIFNDVNGKNVFSIDPTITIISDINTDTTWYSGNTYFITAMVNIKNNATLTIQPGTIIKFMGGTYLNIASDGSIIAKGTQENKIHFTSCKDQSIGEDLSNMEGCDSSPQNEDYPYAINYANFFGVKTPDANDLADLNISFASGGIRLRITHRETAILSSIHDCNFQNLGSSHAISFDSDYYYTYPFKVRAIMNVYNNTFTNIKATTNYFSGAAINLHFSDITNLFNNSFSNNETSGDHSYGGAISLITIGTITNLFNNNFINNKAQSGGAIYMEDGSITNLFNNTFTNNTATSSGGVGGAISCIINYACSTNIYDNNFTGNTAYSGGAISQGVIENIYNNHFVKNIAIGNNQSSGGGAIFRPHISNLYNNLFKDNEAAGMSNFCQWGGGGAIKLWVDDYIINLYNNSFINSKNQAICSLDSAITNLYNNIFAFNDTAINKAYLATISNLNYNAYWQNDTNCMGISCGENDVDFTSNPFLGDDSDKNFLIVSSQVGIVRDKGTNIGDDTFFNSKTIGVDSLLDAGLRDIGYHYPTVSLQIISPTNGSSFYQNQTMNVQFTAKDQGDGPVTGLTQVEYKLKDSDDWITKNIEVVGAGVYAFAVQSPSTVGTNLLIVKAKIGEGYVLGIASYTVYATDLYIDSIKPIQVIEDVNIVANKATVVRVTVKNIGGPTRARTKLVYNGQDYYQTETISDSNTLDFYPNSYSMPGKYQISAIVDDDNQIPETNENNNIKIVDVNVVDTKGLKILFLRFDYNSLDVYLADVNLVSTFLFDTYPTVENKSKLASSTFPFNSTLMGGSIPFLGPSLVLQFMNISVNLLGGNGFDRLVGLVPQGWFEQHWKPGVVGLSYLGGKVVLIEAGGEWNQDTLAHELGHTYNLCDEYKRSFWDDQNNTLANIGGCPNTFPLNCTDQEYCQGNTDINGFSVRNKDSRKTGEPANYNFSGQVATWFSFMGSSGSFTWASKESYVQLLRKLGPNGSNDPQILLIRGAIDANGDIKFYDFYLTDGYPYGITDGNYTIELQDINNEVVGDINFGPPLLADLNWGKDINTTAFDFAIEYNPNIHKIIGKYAGNTKVERSISSIAPSVTISYPKEGDVWTDTNSIQWSVTDSDSNNLSYSLFYTFDNGTDWYPIALDVADTNYTWNVNEVDPKDNYKIKVIATDGVLTGDNNSGTFTIQAPNIELSPYLWNLGRQAKGRILESNFTITNSGNADLDIFSINPSSNINISGISLPLTLQQNESQTFTATIDTMPLLGDYSDDININSNDPNESIKTIFVDGNIQETSPQISVDISMPYEVNYPNSFSLNAIVTTQNAPLRDANITINLPEGLSTTSPLTFDLGTVFESGSKDVNWNIDVNQVGLFEIVLTVSSINASDFNESELVAVTRIELTSVSTDKNSYYPAETVRIDSNFTNFNSSVTYTNLDLNITITDPQDNNTTLHTDVNAVFAGATQKVTTNWSENKISGNYKATSYLYNSSGQLLGSNSTTFEVSPSTMVWILGYGGNKIIGQDYNATYSILPQPTKKMVGEDYNLIIGWWQYYEN